MKNILKLSLIFILVVLLGVFNTPNVRGIIGTETPEPTISFNKNNQVMLWLQALCEKDYSTCDSYVASDGFRITNFESTSTNQTEVKIYKKFIDLVVDSIKKIEVTNIQEDGGTGYTKYTIYIEYTPYERITELNIDEKELLSLVDDFASKKINKAKFTEKVQSYYLNLFKSCFKLSKDDTVATKSLTLSEKKDENGVVKVYNTKTFIESLISDELYNNLEVYQNEISTEVNMILEQY